MANGRLDMDRGGAGHPDAAIATDSATLRGLVFGDRDLAEALKAGDLTFTGGQETVAQSLRLFPRPASVQPAPARGVRRPGRPEGGRVQD